MLFSPQYGWWHTCCCASRWHCKSRTLASEDWGGPARLHHPHTRAATAAYIYRGAARGHGGVVSSTSRMRVLASFILASSVVYTGNQSWGLGKKQSIIRPPHKKYNQSLTSFIYVPIGLVSVWKAILDYLSSLAFLAEIHTAFLHMFAHILFLKILLIDLD